MGNPGCEFGLEKADPSALLRDDKAGWIAMQVDRKMDLDGALFGGQVDLYRSLRPAAFAG